MVQGRRTSHYRQLRYPYVAPSFFHLSVHRVLTSWKKNYRACSWSQRNKRGKGEEMVPRSKLQRLFIITYYWNSMGYVFTVGPRTVISRMQVLNGFLSLRGRNHVSLLTGKLYHKFSTIRCPKHDLSTSHHPNMDGGISQGPSPR